MQLQKMNHKSILDNWIAFIGGVSGGGVTYTMMIEWHEQILKIMIAGITAMVAGGMGVAGKYLFVWTWKKIKSKFFKS